MKKQYNQPSLVLTTMATSNFCNYSIDGQRLYTGETADPNTKVDQSGNPIDPSVLEQVHMGEQW